MTPTTEQCLASARRELAMRKNVYPRWVQANRMKQDQADHELACSARIVEILQRTAHLEAVSEEMKSKPTA